MEEPIKKLIVPPFITKSVSRLNKRWEDSPRKVPPSVEAAARRASNTPQVVANECMAPPPEEELYPSPPESLEELKIRLNIIHGKGFIKSRRDGDTGVGHLLERELGVKENNLKEPDLKVLCLEVKGKARGKSGRDGTKVSMFCQDSWADEYDFKKVIEEFGYIDKKGVKALRCLIGRKVNNQGFHLDLDLEEELLLKHGDKIILRWKYSDLKKRFEEKMPNILLGIADRREVNEEVEFWYNEIWRLENGNVETFLRYLKEGIINIEFRMRLEGNGREAKNHGVAFRISKKNLFECYGLKERLI